MTAEDIDRELSEFGALLHAVVHDGASIGFVLPFSETDARQFWTERVRPDLAGGTRDLFVAWTGNRIAGSVQLFHGTPANQPHRADVNKLMVHPSYRRRGIAKTLMTALERKAKAMGRSLITLDTRTGDTAEPLYTALGYRTVGVIPNFCRDTVDANRLDPTTIMYKEI
ncbi:GNAT family N-acetyltransferase [Hwanghaeella grinnelliae]|uniref:GNAT family N-acetyltransferase n=2 Tax=Hwanghaeella grinnelliae TaxID=2500179 RepID=A0A437QYU2_9PROT|nr:GNAT family N-acetyltransferase [Hwanghaeella grinnelliae]